MMQRSATFRVASLTPLTRRRVLCFLAAFLLLPRGFAIQEVELCSVPRLSLLPYLCDTIFVAFYHCGRAFGNLLAQKPALVHLATNCTQFRSALRQMYLLLPQKCESNQPIRIFLLWGSVTTRLLPIAEGRRFAPRTSPTSYQKRYLVSAFVDGTGASATEKSPHYANSFLSFLVYRKPHDSRGVCAGLPLNKETSCGKIRQSLTAY